MFGIGVEELGKLLGAGVSACVIGLLTWLGAARNRREADAPARPPPAAMGIVLDGDTAEALLATARAIRDDLERWRVEDLARAAAEAKDGEIRDLKAQLAQASGVTHDNQADIRGELDDLKRLIRGLAVH